jgi:hypothetical protein
MKFKKISAILGGILMAGLTIGSAAAAAYPAPFVDAGVANVAIVYGTGAGVSSLDMVQAGNIQTSLGSFVKGDISVDGGEAFKLEKTSNYFNFNESLNTVYSEIDKDEMDFLADGTYDDGDIDEDYEQSITMGSGTLKLFSDSDYEDSEPTVGFMFVDDETILTYEVEYDSAISFADMEDTDLPLFGGEYYVLDASADNTTLQLLDSAEKTILSEGESITVGGKTVSIDYISSTEVKFNVDGETTDKLNDHEYYELSDESYIVANEILYSDKEAGISKVEFSIGAGLMTLESGQEIEINDEKVDGVVATFTGSGALTKIAIAWNSHKDTFLTEDNSLTMPGFEAISLAFGGLDADSDVEEIIFSSGDTLELQMDNFNIPLMNSESAEIYLGEDGNYLVTAASTLTSNYTGDAASYDNVSILTGGLDLMEGDRFIVTVLADDNSDIEQEYYEVTSIDYTSSTDAELELEDLIGDNDLSFDEVEDIDRSEFNFNILAMNTTAVYLNVTSGTDVVTFNKIVSDKGAVVTVEALERATAATIGSSALTLREADEDEDVNGGAIVTIGVTNSTNDKLYTTVANSGTVTKEETTDDKYIGYVESVMASKIITDESGDEYDLTIEYAGKEAIADVQVITGGAVISAAGALGDVLVKDTEVSTVQSKNLVIVGGSCINSAAATVLGGAYCGAAFTEATGVGEGQFLIKGVQDKFTTGKLALVVAGYEAADTVNAATYLTMKKPDLSEDWKGTSATEAISITETA